MQTLTFNQTSFDIIDQNNQIWLRSKQIAQALGYSDESSINRLYARNQDEFTEQMTGTVKLTDPQGELQITRIFSLRGAHLIAMFARTKIAKEFRKWVLDVLEHHTQAHNKNSFVQEQSLLLQDEETLTISKDDAYNIIWTFIMAIHMNDTIRFLEKPMRLLGNSRAGTLYSQGYEYRDRLLSSMTLFEKLLQQNLPEGGKHHPIYGYQGKWDNLHKTVFPSAKNTLIAP